MVLSKPQYDVVVYHTRESGPVWNPSAGRHIPEKLTYRTVIGWAYHDSINEDRIHIQLHAAPLGADLVLEPRR